MKVQKSSEDLPIVRKRLEDLSKQALAIMEELNTKMLSLGDNPADHQIMPILSDAHKFLDIWLVLSGNLSDYYKWHRYKDKWISTQKECVSMNQEQFYGNN